MYFISVMWGCKLHRALISSCTKSSLWPAIQKLRPEGNQHSTNVIQEHLMSYEPRKQPSYFPLYWLLNRDPYQGLL